MYANALSRNACTIVNESVYINSTIQVKGSSTACNNARCRSNSETINVAIIFCKNASCITGSNTRTCINNCTYIAIVIYNANGSTYS